MKPCVTQQLDVRCPDEGGESEKKLSSKTTNNQQRQALRVYGGIARKTRAVTQRSFSGPPIGDFPSLQRRRLINATTGT